MPSVSGHQLRRHRLVVLLDVDGTLIDSNDAHALAWVELGRRARLPIGFDHIRWLIGMGGDHVLPIVAGIDPASPEGEALLEQRGNLFREEFLPKLKPFPGARDLVQHLRDRGHQLVVATSAGAESMRALLEQAGLDDLLELRTSSDDAATSKPAPDIVHAALQRAHASPMHAVMIGDTPYDVAAARNAGVPMIGVLCGGWTKISLAGAREIYADPRGILGGFESSMLARA